MSTLEKLRRDVRAFLIQNPHIKPRTLSLRVGKAPGLVSSLLDRGAGCMPGTMDKLYAIMEQLPTEDRALRGHLPPEEIAARKGGA